jgi:Peptidase A4 family
MPAAARLSILACAAVGALVLVPSAAGAATAVSTNWAGYVAVPASSGAGLSSVSGSWQQPAASCTAGRATYSAEWVGLGGYHESARSLEQIGTDADCTRAGHPRYSTWFELLPGAPVDLTLKVHPGDQVAASVTVRGNHVTLRMRDLSTGARFATTVRTASIDASSAEWIVEAPSACSSASRCRTLPLADFGVVSFSSATATARGQTAAIGDPSWASTELELRQGVYDVVASRNEAPPEATSTLVLATPSPAVSGAFSVRWQEQAVASQAPSGPTLPGFAGGTA